MCIHNVYIYNIYNVYCNMDKGENYRKKTFTKSNRPKKYEIEGLGWSGYHKLISVSRSLLPFSTERHLSNVVCLNQSI